jgi:hypothetical protein
MPTNVDRGIAGKGFEEDSKDKRRREHAHEKPKEKKLTQHLGSHMEVEDPNNEGAPKAK